MMLSAMFLLAYFVQTTDSTIVKFLGILMIIFFSFNLVMSIKKEGFPAIFCTALGCTIIIMNAIITNDVSNIEKSFLRSQLFSETMSEQVHIIQLREYLHIHSLFVGIFCIGLGLIFAYKPTLIRVKNYLPFEYPYPIWNSKEQPIDRFSTNYVSIKSLLTEKERMLCCRFQYLLVLINNDLYYVSPKEIIPNDSQIIRTKLSKTLCGISKI